MKREKSKDSQDLREDSKESTSEPMPEVDLRPPLVFFPEDKPLNSEKYLYLVLKQMAPRRRREADSIGCYKTREYELFRANNSISAQPYCTITTRDFERGLK